MNNIGAAYQVALSESDHLKRYHQLIQLRAIADQPKPFYISAQRSVRLFTIGQSLQGLNRPLRKIVGAGWLEFDLRASQLAIIAVEWQIPFLYDLLTSGKNIWVNILRDISCGVEAKGALKKAMYATVYGMAEYNIPTELRSTYKNDNGHDISDESIELFLRHPLFTTILQAREKQFALIKKNGGARDCFGRWISLDSAPSHRSVLAQVSQARELQLLEPVIEMANKEAKKDRSEFRIVLWQHDGFSVAIRQSIRKELWKRRILDATNQHIRRMKYPTLLECEEL